MTPPHSGDLARAAARKAAGLPGRDEVVRAQQTVTIGRSPRELSAWFAVAKNIDRVVGDLATVSEPRPSITRWTVDRNGRTAEYETSFRTIDDRELRWVSTDQLAEDSVRLLLSEAPAGRGTEVRLQVALGPHPGLPITVSRQAADGALLKALHRAKALVETGEIGLPAVDPAERSGGV